jgi:hypothetical protein
VREQTVVNRITTVHDKLFLAQLVENMRDAILSAGAATADEIGELSAAVAAAAEEPGTVFLQARRHKVSGAPPQLGGVDRLSDILHSA